MSERGLAIEVIGPSGFPPIHRLSTSIRPVKRAAKRCAGDRHVACPSHRACSP